MEGYPIYSLYHDGYYYDTVNVEWISREHPLPPVVARYEYQFYQHPVVEQGSITLLSPEDEHYFWLNEYSVNDTVFFDWANTYQDTDPDGNAYYTKLWLGIIDPEYGDILDYTLFDKDEARESVLYWHLSDMMEMVGLPDTAVFIWDVLHFSEEMGPDSASDNYLYYLYGDDLGSDMHVSDNGPFWMLGMNENDPYHYIDLVAVVLSLTGGDSTFWYDHDLEVTIGDCYEGLGDNWYSVDWVDGYESLIYFYTDCEEGTDTYYQYRVVPGDGFSNEGYELEADMFTDLGIDTTIWHEVDIYPLPEQYIGITETGGVPGDTVSVSVFADLGDDYPMHAFQVTVAGLGGGDISAVGVDTAGTVMGSDWLWEYYISDSGNVVITAGAGAEAVTAMGSLFNVQFVIDGGSSGGFFPVFITDAMFNEDEDMQFQTEPGGVLVLGIGDVSMNGSVSALDASLILQHLVGIDTLSGDQESVGDVTDDNSLSALDAAIILGYVVGSVEDLPYAPGSSMIANADFMISSGSVDPGESFQVPIEVTDGTNVRSFELELSYDPQVLSVDQIVWDTDVLSGLQVLDKEHEGMVKVSAAGMGSLSSGALTLGYIEFSMDEFFNDYETSVTISRSRTNESDVIFDGSVGVYTNSMLVVSDWGDGGLPAEFALKQNYPNPFNPSTMIRYQLPEQTNVTVAIYDIMGRKVRTLLSADNQLAGYRQVLWNATNDFGQPVSAGMYIYTIQAGTFRMTKKMVLMK